MCPLLVKPDVTFTEYYSNMDGSGKKWILDLAGSWYYVKEDGSVYKWGGSGGTDTLLGGVDPSRYTDPRLLVQPTKTYQVQFAEYYPNLNGSGKKWMLGKDSKWYYIKANGSLYRYDSVNGDTMVGGEDSSKYVKPQTLINPDVIFTEYYPGLDKSDRKFILSNTAEWYYIKSDGSIYHYGGANADALVGGVDPSRYTDPRLLVQPTKTYSVEFAEYYPGLDGSGKKWVLGRDSEWYYIKANGAIYKYDKVNGDTFMGGEDPSRYVNPQALVKPDVVFTEYYPNLDKSDRKFVLSNTSEWYYIKGDGKLYKRGVGGGSDTLIGGLDPSRYNNPKLMIKPSVTFSEYYPGLDKSDRKFVLSNTSEWYYIKADGSVYKWGGSSGDDTYVGAEDPSRYVNPLLMEEKKVTLQSYSHEASGKKWFLDNAGQWFYLRKDGAIYEYGGGGEDVFKGSVNPKKY